MSAFGSASALVFASLGVVAVALALLARSYSVRAMVTGLVGLLALAAASTWLILTGPQAASPVVAKLNSDLETKSQELQQVLKLNADLATKTKELENALDVLKARPTGPAQTLVPEILAPDPAHSTPASKPRGDDRAPGVPSQNPDTAKLQTEVADLKARIAQAERRERQRVRLTRRIDTPFYILTPLDGPHLVSGEPGTWYRIRLKVDGMPFVFADRQFRALTAANALIASMERVIAEELAPIAELSSKRRLFLRGGADPRAVLGPAESPPNRELQVLPRLPEGTYASTPQPRLAGNPIRNEDLPSLRADWLREQIRPLLEPLHLATTDVGILDNPPAEGQERTAEVIWYVEW
jgi:hypothetical protein